MIVQQRFGRFEILRRLGRSMTDVYLARDCQSEDTVVLKIIEHLSDGAARLTAEAEKRGAAIQQQLSERDSRILKVYDYGEQDDCFYVALEYFPGRTLAEILKVDGALGPQRAAGYAVQICRQLQTLHQYSSTAAGSKTAIIHGDIKPSNIQVNEQDELRLLDFGIAKLIRPGHDLTHHQLGSPSYCSPERLRESRVDVHADLWALGVTVYEMLAGSPPFQAADTRRLEKLIQLRQLPRELPASCPAALRAIVGRALSPELNHRYASAAAFEADLERFVGHSGQSNQKTAKPSEPTSIAVPPVREQPGKNRRALDRSNVAIGLLAGVLAGLLLCVPAAGYFRMEETGRLLTAHQNYHSLPASVLAADWQHYQTLAHQSGWLKQLVPVADDVAAFRKNLVSSAETLIARFRRSSDDPLNLRWSEPRLLLLYAYEIDRNDRQVEGELRLCDGYLHLKDAQPEDVRAGVKEFRQASALLPHSPDPHLGLAYAYVYDLHNVNAAATEFEHAAQTGYRLHPRDWQQQADAYMFRAAGEFTRAKRLPKTAKRDIDRYLQMTHGDLEQARSLYQPIASFGHAGARLEQISISEDEQAKFETALQPPVRPKTHMVLLKMKYVSRTGASRWR